MTANEFLEAGTVAKSTSCFHEDGRCTVTIDALTHADLQRTLRTLADEIDGEEPRARNVRSVFLEASRTIRPQPRPCPSCGEPLTCPCSEEPDALDQVHERGYQMGYADAVIDAAGGGLDREILDAESWRRTGESGADVLKAPRLVDGRVMRGDVEVEPKCPICGTGITCPCGVGIGTGT